MTEWKTLGEAVVERELKKEKRAGVDHYVMGQAHALLAGEPGEDGYGSAAILTFCSALGVVILPVLKKGSYWLPAMNAGRVVGLRTDYGLRPLPDDWEPSDEMKAVLEELG